MKVKERLPIGRLRYLRPLQPRVNPPWNRLQQSERHRPIGRNAGLRIQSTQKKDETPGPTGPGMPISYAPKYTDDDWDLRDTAATPKGASTQESRGGMRNYVNTPMQTVVA